MPFFVGVEAYEAAGGTTLHDLFHGDDGGWLEDPALLDRLVSEKLQAEAIATKGWKWIEVSLDLPYGYNQGKRPTSAAVNRRQTGRALSFQRGAARTVSAMAR